MVMDSLVELKLVVVVLTELHLRVEIHLWMFLKLLCLSCFPQNDFFFLYNS